MPKLIHLQVACSENRVIGREGRLPWHIPEDFNYFQKQTAGQIVILGRICFETWPGAQLDQRRAIVITPRVAPAFGSVQFEDSLFGALAVAERLPGEIHVCGGERIFKETLALDRPMRLHLTLIHAEISGDRFFPEWRHLQWRETGRRDSADSHYRYTFLTLER